MPFVFPNGYSCKVHFEIMWHRFFEIFDTDFLKESSIIVSFSEIQVETILTLIGIHWVELAAVSFFTLLNSAINSFLNISNVRMR